MPVFDGYEHYGDVPYDPESRPGGELGDIFDNNNWDNWDGFYSDKLGIPSEHDPESERAPMNAPLDDFIFFWDDVGLLDYIFFELTDNGIEYIVAYEEGK